eukprot:IDg21347t1
MHRIKQASFSEEIRGLSYSVRDLNFARLAEQQGRKPDSALDSARYHDAS